MVPHRPAASADDRQGRRRLRWLGAALLLVAAACAETSGDAVTGSEPAAQDATATHTTAARDACTPLADLPGGDVANAPEQNREFPWDRADPAVLDGFDFTQVISGGPPPDGIRPIDTPCFDDVGTAGEWLEPQSPVMVVEVEGDRRAYPLAIMTQHEIVNDVIGGTPVVVTYCPLCNSGLAFERTVVPEGRGVADGQVLDFGTSGRLFQSNLVMYDRQTKTLWTQFTGEAVVGEDFLGTELVRIATSLVGWADFAEATPEGLVLSRDSVSGRDYGRNPYPGYEGAGDGFLFDGPRDDRLPPNTRVVGLGTDIDPVAVVLEQLRTERVVDVEVDGEPVTLWWAPGQASALDRAQVDDGADVGSTGAFVSILADGEVGTFTQADGEEGLFTDEETGSTWNLLGEAVGGELTGSRLQPVPLDDTFWFVWFAFQPDTAVIGADALDG
ncbi:MAG: DUF3179 domain-containing protein [Euzebyales bacterium]|jgi:hypothetical protein|nr:DUF3179 domain-containing protein [Euzebyales bacterium]